MLTGAGVAAAAAASAALVIPAMQRARVASATAPELVSIVREHPHDTRLTIYACRQLLVEGHNQDVILALSNLPPGSAGESGGESSADRASLIGLRAEAEVLAGHIAAGLADATRATDMDPACVPAQAALAFWSERLANWPEASARLHTVADAAPDDQLVQYHLARTLMEEGDFVRASEILKTAVHLHPSNYEYRAALGAVQAYSGRFRDAANTFKEAYPQDDRSFEARANVARSSAFAARSSEECQRQERPISQLLLSDPEPALDQEILGLLELHAGDTIAAQDHLEAAAQAYRARALSLRTYAPGILKNLVIIHALNGKDEQASRDIRDASAFDAPLHRVAQLRDSVIQNPDDAQLHLQLARSYETLDASADALKEYEELIRLQSHAEFARSRIEQLSARPIWSLIETEWPWRVLATETGLKLASSQ